MLFQFPLIKKPSVVETVPKVHVFSLPPKGNGRNGRVLSWCIDLLFSCVAFILKSKIKRSVNAKLCSWLPSCSCRSPDGGSSSAPSSPPTRSASRAHRTWTRGTSGDGEYKFYCKAGQAYELNCEVIHMQQSNSTSELIFIFPKPVFFRRKLF